MSPIDKGGACDNCIYAETCSPKSLVTCRRHDEIQRATDTARRRQVESKSGRPRYGLPDDFKLLVDKWNQE